jgi:twitching motility protein PilT
MNIFETANTLNASDIHISQDNAPTYRVNGVLILRGDVLSKEKINNLIDIITNNEQKVLLHKCGEVDISYQIDKMRFRINIYKERGDFALAIRLIPNTIKTLEQLRAPEQIKILARIKKGLILVTGPTGAGKSTTLAAIINQINSERSCHIVTIEDPIEFLHKNNKSVIHQREVYKDSQSFSSALRAALREDPDVILIGEMRDSETIATAVTAAETGHLVFGTLHTYDAGQTVDRIIDTFPGYQQNQIRMQLSLALQGIISQQLLPLSGGAGRVAAFEVLLANMGIRNLIRNGKTHQILPYMDSCSMLTMEKSLEILYKQGHIAKEDYLDYSPKERIIYENASNQ